MTLNVVNMCTSWEHLFLSTSIIYFYHSGNLQWPINNCTVNIHDLFSTDLLAHLWFMISYHSASIKYDKGLDTAHADSAIDQIVAVARAWTEIAHSCKLKKYQEAH